MEKLQDRGAIRRFILLASAAYLVSYLTRINFGTVIFEMVRDTGFDRAALSTAITGAFITYGAGQVLSGWCGDRMQPRTLIVGGLLVSSLINALIPLCTTPGAMTALWCVNGLAQAFLWPPLVRLMTAYLSDEDYTRATVWVQFGSSLGTILLYLVSPLLISLSGWRLVFFTSAACGVLMAAVCLRCCRRVDHAAPAARADVPRKTGAAAALLTPLMLSLMLAIVLIGALRDGVTTWMPSYIGDTYHLGSAVSILTGVAMPLFGMVCQKLALSLYRRFQSPPLAASALCGGGVAAILVLLLANGRNAPVSVASISILSATMYGANLIVTGFIPAFFRDTGNVSTISGILNACVYIGSALSTYGFASLSEHSGWNAVVLLWLGLAVACGGIFFACAPAWKRRFSK